MVHRSPAGIAAFMDLWWSNLALIANHAPGAAHVEQDVARDKRFQDKAWGEDPLRLLRDLYLLNSNWVLSQVRAAQTLDSHDRHKLEFYTRQLLSALSPSNWPTANPRVRVRTLETCGRNLLQGLDRLVDDLEHGKGLLPITHHDTNAFKVGRNLAITPGKVVFRNALIELIQFSSTTKTVFRTPLLVVPPGSTSTMSSTCAQKTACCAGPWSRAVLSL
jgi:polyhydroxyalkanoate synthase